MIFKVIFLIMLWLPIACFQCCLLIDVTEDLKKHKKTQKRATQPVYEDYYFQSEYLKVVK